MSRLKELLSEDSNQYGPGTDLMVSLMAVLLVTSFINSSLLGQERAKNKRLAQGGNFRVASDSFSAGDFKSKPFKELVNREGVRKRLAKIAQEYNGLKKDFPYIFVIGHATEIDDPTASDKSVSAKLVRNWNFAGERAALISGIFQAYLNSEDKEKLIVVSTGEFDKRDPSVPEANAWVEVVFGADWKPPRKLTSR